MRRLAAELGRSENAAAFLREELERLGQERGQLEETLRRSAPKPEAVSPEAWAAWWESAGLSLRRQAAGLLFREVRLFPDHGEILLR